LTQGLVQLRRDRSGAASAGREVIALIYAMALGAEVESRNGPLASWGLQLIV
jgi:hypothetical protein